MNVKRHGIDLGFKVMNTTHRAVLLLSAGRVGRSIKGKPMVELLTIGRKSGMVRSTMLLAPVVDGARVILVASKGGDDRDPDWYRNLLAHPDVELTMNGEQRPMRARPATLEEEGQLWPRVVESYKGYATYRERTTRDIPLVVCEPR
ncbi:MAG TPA: nitroreductase/quinone reductase family protein [Acidimicrobiales bacterium]|jgi:deazaflavin-dependent oxidoreductase (nitroreductase family)|nr:nitroreductase/quinone reductase family protein [Acidimicrobiales bacterium]